MILSIPVHQVFLLKHKILALARVSLGSPEVASEAKIRI